MNDLNYDMIHRYLKGTLEAAEREAFEAAIANDPALQKAVAFERLLLAGLDQIAENQLRQTISNVHQQLRSEAFFQATESGSPLTVTHTSKSFVMKRILAIAATFAVLASAVWFFTQKGAPADPNALFTQYYQPQTDVQRAKTIVAKLESFGLAGVPSDTDTLRQALQLYEAGKYNESLALLNGYSEMHPSDETAQYYLGVIHMSQEHYAKAIELLLPLSRAENSEFKNDAAWNLGLCYLKTTNGQEDARAVFIKLSEDNSYPNHRGAKAIVDQLLPK